MIHIKIIATFLCLIFLMFNCQKDPADPGKPTPTPKPGPTEPYNNLFALDKFVKINPGTFQMGSTLADKKRGVTHNDEFPQHTVRISKTFYIGKHEVTQEQWEAVITKDPSHFANRKKNPVEYVTLGDVEHFLEVLNQKYGRNIFRLPTEAEWEYACRAGTTGDYAGTGKLNDMGWYSANSGNHTHPVGLKRPNAWGLYDMHGNVWEWCSDKYDSSYYKISPPVDPKCNIPTTMDHVVRGGSFDYTAIDCRSATRHADAPSHHFSHLGFRLVRKVE